MPNNKGNLRPGHFILTIPDFNILDNDKKKNNGNNCQFKIKKSYIFLICFGRMC